jgi:hypothetical protein
VNWNGSLAFGGEEKFGPLDAVSHKFDPTSTSLKKTLSFEKQILKIGPIVSAERLAEEH